MGDAKRKQYNRKEFLLEHRWCVYCGAPAVTTDHCPPRCFFEGRQWPETYEFPACSACNAEARLDEQALAVLIRPRLTLDKDPSSRREWESLVQGVKNNQPAVLQEWQSFSPSRKKRTLRAVFGAKGDQMRSEGWGAVNIGPLTGAMIERFMVKLGKALYYRHNKTLLDGTIYALHINILNVDQPSALMADMLQLAPGLSQSQRNNMPLTDQFIYRFNNSHQEGVMYAVVQFSEQFMFQLIVLSDEMAAKLVALNKQQGGPELPIKGRYECQLKHRPEMLVAKDEYAVKPVRRPATQV